MTNDHKYGIIIIENKERGKAMLIKGTKKIILSKSEERTLLNTLHLIESLKENFSETPLNVKTMERLEKCYNTLRDFIDDLPIENNQICFECYYMEVTSDFANED